MTSRSHTACRNCGRNAHGRNDDHLCGKCWREKRDALREERLQQRIAKLSHKVVGEHEIGLAIAEVVGPRHHADDWITTSVIQGVEAAVAEGELTLDELKERSLMRATRRFVPEVRQIFREITEEDEVAVPDDTQPKTAEEMVADAAAYHARNDNMIDLYRNTPVRTEDLAKAFGINVSVLYEILKKEGTPKRSEQPDYKAPKYGTQGSLVEVDGRVEWVPPSPIAAEAMTRAPRKLRQEDLLARVEALQAQLEQVTASAQPAPAQAPPKGPQWRVSWEVVQSGEQVVEARTMAEAIALIHQQVGAHAEITGAVRE